MNYLVKFEAWRSSDGYACVTRAQVRLTDDDEAYDERRIVVSRKHTWAEAVGIAEKLNKEHRT